MNDKIREFLKTGKGKLTVACGALLLSWIFLLTQLGGSFSSWFPNEARKEALRKEIKKLEAEQAEQQKKLREMDEVQRKYRGMIENSWQYERDGDPELLLRRAVEVTAKETEISLNNLGSVRTSRINDDFYFAELDVSFSAPFENLMRFIAKLQENKPALPWRRITANLSMRPPHQQNTRVVSNTATTAATQTTLMFNGTIRVIAFDGELPPEGKTLARIPQRRGGRK